MASFANANLDSDSESDDSDYDPTKDGEAANLSEEENSGVDEGGDADGKKKGKKKSKKAQSLTGKRGIFEADDEIEEVKEDFSKEKEEMKEMKEQQKMDDLWADFKKDAPSTKPKVAPKPSGSSLGSWSIASKSKVVKKVQPPPQKKVSTNIFDIFDEVKSPIEETPTPTVAPTSILSSIIQEKLSNLSQSSTEEPKEEEKEEEVDSSKIKITKVYDFAGEAIEVTSHVSKDSKEGKVFLKSQESGSAASGANKRPGGLGSILGDIAGKKPKLGTLDKSKMDWNQFVEQEGIKEDLQIHNKGKDGYVEKQMFLERADLRRFEIEKQNREKVRKAMNK